MSYTVENFKTKKALKEAVLAGLRVEIYNPGLGTPVVNGRTCLEGPHYPKPHSWYATVEMKDGYVVKVR